MIAKLFVRTMLTAVVLVMFPFGLVAMTVMALAALAAAFEKVWTS